MQVEKGSIHCMAERVSTVAHNAPQMMMIVCHLFVLADTKNSLTPYTLWVLFVLFPPACVRVTQMTSEGIHWAGKWHVRRHVTDAGA